MNDRSGAFCSVDNVSRRLIQHRMVVSFHPNSDTFIASSHRKSPSPKSLRKFTIAPKRGIAHVREVPLFCQRHDT
jgi:hypothetical protein